ncbi:primosomal protein DnaI [Aneurinibacillus sp. Ricciae_BoGa-3]|uniref:primosomal protein DnaI n=1 Tax=Aneurinibacillus sp. Ricciae_BoGa-3 TaxID=3022697 RepID=UPI00234259D7|nr:primosomal protein DnaI [Aneurinibacillus sp. Ricciae_BoGa-3]WCK55529.1 primosomal protein DnaI [Aneurinibacillus sp. Ricciae_BoGa-3]
MQQMNKILSAYRNNRYSFEQIVEELTVRPEVQELLVNHSEIKPRHITQSVTRIKLACDEADNCRACPGLADCANLLKGHQALLEWTGLSIEAQHRPCRLELMDREQRQREKLIQTHHIPKEISLASFANIDPNPERAKAIAAMMEFSQTVQPGQPGAKGVYLYGPFGVGKSHLMGAAARRLAERGIASLMVYMPDFFRELKDSFSDNSVQQKIDVLKQVPVLILDDIGAETLSPWARDEILGAILQYRVSENFPVLYTSNYNYDELQEHLSYSQKAGMEQLKAMRIMERIRYYTDDHKVDGDNRRIRK